MSSDFTLALEALLCLDLLVERCDESTDMLVLDLSFDLFDPEL